MANRAVTGPHDTLRRYGFVAWTVFVAVAAFAAHGFGDGLIAKGGLVVCPKLLSAGPSVMPARLEVVPAAALPFLYGWSVGVFVVCLISIFAVVYSLHLLGSFDRPVRRSALLIAVVFSIGMGAYSLMSTHQPRLAELRCMFQTIDQQKLRDLMSLIIAASGCFYYTAVSFLVATASATMSIPPSRAEFAPEDLDTRVFVTRRVLYVGAVLLVVGMISTQALTGVPKGFAQLGYEQEILARLASTAQLRLGLLYTLLLLLAYLPPALLIHGVAEARGRAADGDPGAASFRLWLADQQASETLTGQFVRLLVMLSPLLTGPATELVKGLETFVR